MAFPSIPGNSYAKAGGLRENAHSARGLLVRSERSFRIALREGALSLGVEAELIASQLRAAFLGTTAEGRFIGALSDPVRVRTGARGLLELE